MFHIQKPVASLFNPRNPKISKKLHSHGNMDINQRYLPSAFHRQQHETLRMKCHYTFLRFRFAKNRTVDILREYPNKRIEKQALSMIRKYRLYSLPCEANTSKIKKVKNKQFSFKRFSSQIDSLKFCDAGKITNLLSSSKKKRNWNWNWKKRLTMLRWQITAWCDGYWWRGCGFWASIMSTFSRILSRKRESTI